MSIVSRTNIMEWSENGEKAFFQVHLALQRLVQTARQAIESGFALIGGGSYLGFGTFETNIPFALRYLVDQSLSGGGWVDVREGYYEKRASTSPERLSTAQLEIDVNYKYMMPGREISAIAPLRILSFDIECWNQLGRGFPEPEKNPVIQIAAEVKVVGTGALETLVQVVWTLDSCGDIADTHVYSFVDERDLLLSFSKFIREIDADFLTGYNIINFDIPYLLKRAAALEIGGFAEFGRLVGTAVRIREFTSQQGRAMKQITCDGRIIFDMFSVILKEHNLRY